MESVANGIEIKRFMQVQTVPQLAHKIYISFSQKIDYSDHEICIEDDLRY